MSIDSNMESMIQMFLKYGVKDSLSVEEFLKFRKQAVKEQLNGLSNKKNESIKVENETDTVDVLPKKQAISPPQKNATHIDNTIIESHKETEKSSDEEKEFSDEEFLKMMREVED